MLNVCLPGTGGFMPLLDRWLTCCWIEYQGHAILIDCGEGTQLALKKADLHLSRLDMIFITHFHADHVAGLAGMLLSLGNTGRGESHPLTIAGPPGLCKVIPALLVIAPLPYPVHLVELSPGDMVPGYGDLTISCIALKHRIPCYGYRIDLKRKPVFSPEKATALEIPKPYWKNLHSGETVHLPDGRTIVSEEVIERARAPISVSYCTDTLPIPEIARFAKGVDLMIAEGMYGDDSMAEKVAEKNHSLYSQSARLAKEAGAKRLWLTHFSPAMQDPEEHLEAVRAIFPNTEAGKDGMKIELDGED